MRKILLVIAILIASACNSDYVLVAQSLPFSATVTWNASPDATTYNCYLDGTLVVTGTTNALTCQVSISSLGAHTVGVTAVNPTFVPPESVPATLAFTLKIPAPPAGIKVK